MGDHTQALVVGGGLAALCAAVRMAQLGVEVVVLERGDEPGGAGNSRVSGGLVHIGWEAMDADPEHLFRTVMTKTDGEVNPALVRTLCTRAAAAVEWLAELGVTLAPHADAPHLRHVMQPHRPSVGVRRDVGRGPDRAMRRLYEVAAARGVDVRLQTEVMSLTRVGEIWEVRALTPDGPVDWRSANVLVADGGFQANQELLTRYVGPAAEQALLRATAASTGDGLRMLLSAGAGATGLGRVYGHMVSLSALESDELWPYPNLDNLCLSSLLIDRVGQPFASRADNGVGLVNELVRTSDPRGFTAVCDPKVWEGPATANPTAVSVANPDLPARGGHYVEADDLGEVADSLGLRTGVLEEAVAAHNRAALRPPVTTAPFRAMRVLPGITFTMGGARIDDRTRVLDVSGRVLPGLYAAGGTAGGVQGGPRGGYVGGLSTALVFGIRAGESIAAAVGADA